MTTAAEGEHFRPSDDEYETLQEDVERARVEGNQKYGYGGRPIMIAVTVMGTVGNKNNNNQTKTKN